MVRGDAGFAGCIAADTANALRESFPFSKMRAPTINTNE
jgi:hypothetical protein